MFEGSAVLEKLGGYYLDLPGKPWFDVLAQICRNSDTTLKTECKINLTKRFFVDSLWAVRAGGSKVNKRQNLKREIIPW